MRSALIVATLFLAIFGVTDVFAASMRCGTHIVNVGDTELTVIKKCGPPTHAQGNRWYYDRGPSRFLKIVVFGNGKVLFIREEMSFTHDSRPSDIAVA
ncbi:MAG: DUF2845 domain-containing protein [Acidiferrobacterales bacterium]